MRIPGIGNIKKLTDQKMVGKTMDMLKKAGINKPVYVIQAEYKNFCSNGKKSAKDKTGFLSVMNHLGDAKAKEWIEKERTKLDKIIEAEAKK